MFVKVKNVIFVLSIATNNFLLVKIRLQSISIFMSILFQTFELHFSLAYNYASLIAKTALWKGFLGK
ncbi:hypothetical protein P8452_70697 [Trifolium repens]|nr:hypothetical protein P8452_70697 [Trifolium repens]